MKFFNNAIAAAAAAAIAVSIGTFAFANDISTPEEPVITDENQVPGNYMYFEWGAGYAKVTNITEVDRYAEVHMYVYSNLTGKEVDHLYDEGTIGHNQSVSVSSTKYSTNSYNFQCVGGIRAGSAAITPIVESENRRYPI